MPRPKRTSPLVDTPEKSVEQGKYWLPADAKWGGFINISINDEEKENYLVWFEENQTMVSRDLDDLLSGGVKFGLSYDRENSCYVSTLTGALVVGSNERYALTTRAGTMTEVIALTCWKFVVLAHGDCGSWSPKTGRLVNWG